MNSKFILLAVIIQLTAAMPQLLHSEQGPVFEEVLPLFSIDDSGLISPSFYLGHIEDPSSSLKQEDVLSSAEYSILKDSRYIYPYNKSSHWFGFKLVNEGSIRQQVILHSDEPFLDEFDLYIRTGGDWLVQKNGLIIPIGERDFKNRLPAFEFSIQPGEEKLILSRIRTERTMLNIGLHLEDGIHFAAEDKLKSAVYLIFLGSILSILLYNLFLLISLRDPLYLYYVIYAFFQGIWVLLYSGYDMYLYTDYRINHFLSCGISISSISMILFITHILDLKNKMPRIYRLIRAMIPLLAALTIATIVNVRFYAVVVGLGMPVTLFLFLIVLRGFIQRIPQSNYLLFGMGGYIIGLFILAGVNIGVVPFSEFSRNAFLAGSFIEFIVFSITLASRVHSLQKETLAAQQNLIQFEKQTNERLTELVEQKTKALSNANDELKELVIKDPLTGLYNRRHLEDILYQEWSRHLRSKTSLCVIMLDIDFFKKYNDHFGHQKGDSCIIEIAGVIQGFARRAPDVPARYGGEEFILILPETKLDDGIRISQNILEAIRQRAIPHISEIGPVTVSIGIACMIPESGKDPEMLVKAADDALYESKSNGRNRVTSVEE